MKKSLTIIALAALVMLAGCKKNEQPTGSTKLIAGIEQHKSDSKTSLDGLQIKWSEGDKLYVYDKDAEEGAIFTLTSGAGTTTGEFTGTYNFTNENVAVYPSSSFSGSGGTIVTMTLPAEQTASTSGTFGNGANPMLGVFSDFNNLTLKSLCGVLCLQLTGNNVNITAIEIVGGPDDKLNGTFTVDYMNPVLTYSANGTNTVRLKCNATLTSTAQKFYVVVPAGTLHGFTMKVYDGDNEIFSKSTTNDIPVFVNTLSTMNELEVTAASNIIDLSTLTGNYEAQDGDILTGTLSQHYNISVAEGASVTLWNASINPGHSYKSPHDPCIRCDNDATIVIEGENDMYVWTEQMPCIYIASGKTLTITGNGSLNASSTGMITAAIGGCYSSGNSCGNIVIESGNITATAGSCAAIGAGFNGNCGNITINGGTITATSTGATAIGCGNQGYFSCGDITINGGNVTATGSRAGIGGGYYSNCGDITITGGTIIATGTSGSGIGAGNSTSGTWGYCGNITISGGNVTASSSDGVGIGGGCLANCGDILISGGTVTATGGNNYVAIGGSTNHTCGSITITEGVTSVTATKGANAPRCIGMGKGDYAICGTVTIGGTVYPDGATPNQTDGLTFVYPVPEPTEQIVDLSTITSAYTAVDGDILTGTLGTGVQISIADGATITLRSANINGSDNLSGTFHGLNCLGDATIILENNDNVVKANCGSENGRAGIYVPRYKTLTFEAGNSSGFVVATGSGEAAGIGGYSNNHCGVIVINSGKVTGTAGTGVDETFGDSYSAGIGSSAYKRCGGIIINGGQVIGTGYGNAAGIGTGGNGICRKEGDTDGSQPAITISNTLSNYVKAQKGSSATYFIGGGPSSKCGIVIVGGTTYEDGGGNRGISSSTSLSDDFTVSGNSLIYMP